MKTYKVRQTITRHITLEADFPLAAEDLARAYWNERGPGAIGELGIVKVVETTLDIAAQLRAKHGDIIILNEEEV